MKIKTVIFAAVGILFSMSANAHTVFEIKLRSTYFNTVGADSEETGPYMGKGSQKGWIVLADNGAYLLVPGTGQLYVPVELEYSVIPESDKKGEFSIKFRFMNDPEDVDSVYYRNLGFGSYKNDKSGTWKSISLSGVGIGVGSDPERSILSWKIRYNRKATAMNPEELVSFFDKYFKYYEDEKSQMLDLFMDYN